MTFDQLQADITARAKELDRILHNLRSRGASVSERVGAIEASFRKFLAEYDIAGRRREELERKEKYLTERISELEQRLEELEKKGFYL